ncbi:MAG TPA: YihY/virulence factor BrkB family protein [Chitinophagaceae bacterium]|nr:YihY/virulence factor BrkB family protein [Chitinophagaceae bacterium]
MTRLETILVKSRPVTWIREWSKRKTLPGLYGLPIYDVWKFFFKQVKNIGLNERAATISFNMVMAIPAATIFLFTLLPYLPISKEIYKQLFSIVRDISPNDQTRKFIIGFLNDFFNSPKRGLLSIGFVLALFYSSNAMMGIIRTFDRSIVEKHRSNFLFKRMRAVALILITIIIIIATALISAGQGELFIFILKSLKIKNAHTKNLIQGLRWIIIVLLFLYSIAFIYKYAPSVKKRWRLLSTGAVFATILITVTTWLFAVWAQNFSNYNRFYGSIGTVLMIMMLIFVNSFILLIGFELNITIHALKNKRNHLH